MSQSTEGSDGAPLTLQSDSGNALHSQQLRAQAMHITAESHEKAVMHAGHFMHWKFVNARIEKTKC